jgi:hypothetical protein
MEDVTHSTLRQAQGRLRKLNLPIMVSLSNHQGERKRVKYNFRYNSNKQNNENIFGKDMKKYHPIHLESASVSKDKSNIKLKIPKLPVRPERSSEGTQSNGHKSL